MAISFVGSANGTTSATLPAHQAGDLIVIFAFRDGSSTPATVPSGYMQITTRATNTAGGVSGYKIAASSSEASGTWTNATGIIVGVYRGSGGTMTVGGSVTAGGASTTVSYAAVTSVNTNYNSWWIGVSGHRSVNTNLQNPPTNMVNRASRVDATDELALHDTNGTALTAWTARTVSVSGTSSGWSAAVIEIYETIADGTSPISLLGVAAKVTSTTTTITPDRTTGSLSGVTYQAGDVFVLSISSWTSGSGTTSMSADWTREANISTTNGPTMAVWWHRYDGVTMPSFTATYSASDTAMVSGVAAFRGVVASGSPFDVTSASINTTDPMSLGAITTTVDGCRILAISGEDGIEDYPEPTGPWSSSIWTDGGGIGNFQHTNGSNGAAIAAWHYAQTVAGTTLGMALALTGTGFGQRAWMGALEPAISGDELFASSILSASSNESPSVAQTHSVAAASVLSASSVGSPSVSQVHSVSSLGIASSSITSAPSIGQTYALTNVGLSASSFVGSPSVEVGVSDEVTASGISSLPIVGSPSIGQSHNVAALSISVTPIIARPSVSQIQALSSASIRSGSFTTSPSVWQSHALSARSINAATSVGSPAIGQAYAVAAVGLSSSSVVSVPSIWQTHGITMLSVSSASLTGRPYLSQAHAIASPGIASAPSVGRPSVGQTHVAVSVGVLSSSTVMRPSLGQSHSLLPAGVSSSPKTAFPSIGQAHALGSIGLSDQTALQSPILRQGHALALSGLSSSVPIGSPLMGQVQAIDAQGIIALFEVDTAILGKPVEGIRITAMVPQDPFLVVKLPVPSADIAADTDRDIVVTMTGRHIPAMVQGPFAITATVS